jgi:AhpC/TSA family
VRLANEFGEIQSLGSDVCALSVDPPERNAALARRWHLPFPIHSDPGGDWLLKQLDLWNPADRGGIAWPAMLIFDAQGREVRRYRSRDFADRPPNDDDLLSDLRGLRLPTISAPTWTPDVEPVDDPGALRTETFGPYFRGIRFGVRGLSGRLQDPVDQQEAIRMSDMATSFLDAWSTRRKAAEAD